MANAEGSDDMLNRVMTKDNIGLAAMLEVKEGAYENGEFCEKKGCEVLHKRFTFQSCIHQEGRL